MADKWLWPPWRETVQTLCTSGIQHCALRQAAQAAVVFSKMTGFVGGTLGCCDGVMTVIFGGN